MKKGIVVEHKRHYSIVMDQQGLFHKTHLMKEGIGEEVNYWPKDKLQSPFFSFPSAAKWKLAVMIVLCLLIGSPLYMIMTEDEAYAVVSIDLNPSMNLTIDRDLQVLEVDAINQDAKNLLEENDLQGQSITSFTEQLLQLTQLDAEFEDGHPVLMAISYLGDKSDLMHFEEELTSYFRQSKFTFTVYEVSEHLRSKAEIEHKSMNELAAQTLEDSTDSTEKQESFEGYIVPALDEKKKEIIRYYYDPNKASSEEEETEDPVEEDTTSEKEVPKEKTNPQQAQDAKEKSTLPPQANERAKKRKAVNNSDNKVKDTNQHKKSDNKHPSYKKNTNKNADDKKSFNKGKENAKKARDKNKDNKGKKGKMKEKKKDTNKKSRKNSNWKDNKEKGKANHNASDRGKERSKRGNGKKPHKHKHRE